MYCLNLVTDRESYTNYAYFRISRVWNRKGFKVVSKLWSVYRRFVDHTWSEGRPIPKNLSRNLILVFRCKTRVKTTFDPLVPAWCSREVEVQRRGNILTWLGALQTPGKTRTVRYLLTKVLLVTDVRRGLRPTGRPVSAGDPGSHTRVRGRSSSGLVTEHDPYFITNPLNFKVLLSPRGFTPVLHDTVRCNTR